MQKGLTLLEVLFSIVLLTMVVSLSVSSYLSYQRSIQLQAAKDDLRSVLYQARQRAIASADNKAWGVKLHADSYTMFSGLSYDSGASANIIYNLEGVALDNYQTAFSDGVISTSSIVFQKQTGSVAMPGTIILRPANNTVPTTSVSILISGAIK